MTDLQLIAMAAGAMVVIVLLALLVNLFKQMTRFALAVGAMLALVILALVALSFASWPALPSPSLEIVHLDGDRQPAQTQPDASPVKPGLSAAVAVRRFLVGAIVVGMLGTVGAVLGQRLWQEYKRRTRLQDALTQAQIYGLLSGDRLPQGLPRRLPQTGGNVIVLGGESQQPVQTPVGQGWEVLQ